MNRLVEDKLDQLSEVCARHKVRRLELFGSAASSGGFKPQGSDLDFLVEFGELSRGEHADAYFGLLGDLENLFQRPIDLVMTRAIKNPHFKEGIASSRVVVYAACDGSGTAGLWRESSPVCRLGSTAGPRQSSVPDYT